MIGMNMAQHGWYGAVAEYLVMWMAMMAPMMLPSLIRRLRRGRANRQSQLRAKAEVMAKVVHQRMPARRIHVRRLVRHDVRMRVDSHHPSLDRRRRVVIDQSWRR